MTPRQATPPRAQPSRQAKPLTAPAVRARKGSGPPLVMVTAYSERGCEMGALRATAAALAARAPGMVRDNYNERVQPGRPL